MPLTTRNTSSKLSTHGVGIAATLAVLAAASLACAEDGTNGDSKVAQPGRSEDVAMVEREAFSIESLPQAAEVGKVAEIVVSVRAKGGFHLNQEYPHKLTLDDVPAGLRVPKTGLTRSDAELGERTLTFKLEATPEKAGRHDLKATLKTSVCDESQCILKSEKLSLRVVGK